MKTKIVYILFIATSPAPRSGQNKFQQIFAELIKAQLCEPQVQNTNVYIFLIFLQKNEEF